MSLRERIEALRQAKLKEYRFATSLNPRRLEQEAAAAAYLEAVENVLGMLTEAERGTPAEPQKEKL